MSLSKWNLLARVITPHEYYIEPQVRVNVESEPYANTVRLTLTVLHNNIRSVSEYSGCMDIIHYGYTAF